MQVPELFRADLDQVHSVVGDRWEEFRAARIFLTGGTGFVGKWLLSTALDASRLRGLGLRITLLTRDPERFRREMPHLALAPEVDLIRGDVRTFDFLPGAFTHVIHAATDVVAGSAPIETLDTCSVGTRRVLDQAVQSGAAKVLLVSSGAVYGAQPAHLSAFEESYAGAPDALKPGSAYGEGKRVSELLGAIYGHAHGLSVKIARCFAFVGPYLALDKHFAVGNFLRDALAHQPIVIQGDGTPVRTYLHASDMSAWLWRILLDGRPGAAYNVGGEEAVSILDLARRVVHVTGSGSSVRVLKEPMPGGPVQRYVPDVRKIQTEFSLPAPLMLDQALAATADWLRSR